MSSIHEALALDVHKGRPHKPNQIVLKSRQEATDGPIGQDFFQRKDMEHKAEQERRRAEGGKHGGFFDRQVVVERNTAAEDEGDVDDFGRRKPKTDKGLSKAARAQAALQRLRRQPASASADGASASASSGSGSRAGSRMSKSRSRSRGR
mmetsp:Transcript_16592/g.41499  ORF Transcript_16592/g.41499 Transcript_16592/m.41499 type:complete len:150 (-) Transcript_16592:46-495(-)